MIKTVGMPVSTGSLHSPEWAEYKDSTYLQRGSNRLREQVLASAWKFFFPLKGEGESSSNPEHPWLSGARPQYGADTWTEKKRGIPLLSAGAHKYMPSFTLLSSAY